MKDRWNSRERDSLPAGHQPGTGWLAASSGFTSSILAGLLRSKCRSRVKWRHNETRTVYDRDLFVQGDKLHAPGTRKMVTGRALASEGQGGEHGSGLDWNKLSTVCQVQFIIICFMFI